MTVALQPDITPSADPIVIEGVSWEVYEALLRDMETTSQNLRITYDRGRMQILSPLPKHEKWKSLLSRFAEAIADAREIPISTYGSTTWKRRARRRGLEADECFYIQHEPQMRGKLEIDLDRDPPPDLAIEIDLSPSAIDRPSVYAALGVPEIWRFDGNRIEALILQNESTYQPSGTSRAFPFLKPAELKQFFDRFGTVDQNSLIKEVRLWTRQLPR